MNLVHKHRRIDITTRVMWSCKCLLVVLLLARQSIAAEPTKPPLCQLVYGIRMGSAGTVEKVLDSARCQNADKDFIQSFLEQIKPQLGGNLLELEISNCALPSLDGHNFLARIGLRRLSIQHSGLETLAVDSLAGQENVLEELDLSGNSLEEIPTAIRNLTALVRLDLSRNRIRSLPQGAVFFHLLKLRHLNLNYNRLGYLDTVRYPSGVTTGQSLPLAIFNLEPLREHVETIQLRSNNLTAFPDQFSRPFGRLRYLDLSSNNFISIPLESFAQMPQLSRLQLDNNKLDQLVPLQLPSSLKAVTLRGNAIGCDCSAVWLWQWSQKQKSLADGAELELDNCIRPERWRGRQLSDLPPDFCQPTDATPTTTEPEVVDNTEDIMRSVSFDAIPSSDGINVTLTMIGNISAAINWTINYRKFGSGKPIGLPITGMLSGNMTQPLVGLLSSTGYQVCVQLVGRTGNQQLHRCLEVLTLSVYPVAEVAVAASVSTSTTLVVVVLVCCCCPRMKCGKKKKNKSGSPDGSHGEVEQKNNKVFTFSSSTNADAEAPGIWSSADQFQPAHFSTFRGLHRPSIDDQSHKVFQATCNYLRQRALDPSKGLGNRNDSQLLQLVQPRRPSLNGQVPVYLAPIPDGPMNPVTGPRRIQQQQLNYFNSSYGLTEFNPSQSNGGAMVDHPYKYCTWRPPKQSRHPPLLSSWTSYPDFLANSDVNKKAANSFQHPLPPYQPAIAVPVYSLTTSRRPRRKRDRFYWSAAPAPIHTVDMQF